MSGLSSKARAFVDTVRLSDEPSAADFERLHSAIAARIAVGGAASAVVLSCADAAAATVAPAVASGMANGASLAVSVVPSAQSVAVASVVAGSIPAASSGGAAALGIPSTLAITAKVAAWVVAIGLTSGALGLTARHRVDPRPTSSTPSAEVAATILPNGGASGASRARATTPAIREASSASPQTVSPAIPTYESQSVRVAQAAAYAGRESTPRVEVPAVVHTPAATRADEPGLSGHAPTLDAELALVRAARTALNEGRAAEALASLDEHARRFPSGVLAEDRVAQRVLALCALDRYEAAEEEGQRFLSSYPRSPHVAAIRGSCAFVAAPQK